VSPLAPGGQTPAVTNTPIAADLDQSSDILPDLLAEISLDPAFVLNHLPDSTRFILGQIFHFCGLIDIDRFKDLARSGSPDTVDIGQANPYLLILRQVDSCDSCHGLSLSLTLLVFRVLANHSYHTVASDDLALRTHSFYGCTDLHRALLIYLSL
jgi:hypothetical protein